MKVYAIYRCTRHGVCRLAGKEQKRGPMHFPIEYCSNHLCAWPLEWVRNIKPRKKTHAV